MKAILNANMERYKTMKTKSDAKQVINKLNIVRYTKKREKQKVKSRGKGKKINEMHTRTKTTANLTETEII